MNAYQFEETGVGCEAHQDPDCLCDVRLLPNPVPVRKFYLPSEAPRGAADGNSFVAWAERAMGLFEALAGINETGMHEALALWEQRAGGKNQAGNRTAAVSLALRSGLTLEQAARWFGTTLQVVLDTLVPDRAFQARLLAVEPYVRRGDMTSKEISEATGASAGFIVECARRWNVKLPHGLRHSPELRAKALAMVKAGMSRRAAARELGVAETCVVRWTRDAGMVPKRGRYPNGVK